jgi:hypothetical protein
VVAATVAFIMTASLEGDQGPQPLQFLKLTIASYTCDDLSPLTRRDSCGAVAATPWSDTRTFLSSVVSTSFHFLSPASRIEIEM